MPKLTLISILLLGWLPAISLASEWQPSGPITMMIAFQAGGGADTQARLIAEELEARHAWKIIPKQVTGKGGTVLAAEMKNQPNDGSVIGILATESLAYNMLAAKNAGYTQDDFTYITTTTGFQMGIVAQTTHGWNTMNDVIETAKNGRKIRFGAMSPRLADIAYLLGKAHDIEFNIIMVKGGKGVMNGLNAGDMDVGWVAGIQSKSVAAGDMVNLASGLPEPLAMSPEAPTLKDLGVEFTADGYFLFIAPAGIPDVARDALAKAIGDAVNDEKSQVGAFVRKAFGGPATLSGPALDDLMGTYLQQDRALLQTASE